MHAISEILHPRDKIVENGLGIGNSPFLIHVSWNIWNLDQVIVYVFHESFSFLMGAFKG